MSLPAKTSRVKIGQQIPLLTMYSFLALTATVGYFFEFGIFLITVIAIGILISGLIIGGLYRIFIRPSNVVPAPKFFVFASVLFLIFSMALYAMSHRVETSGFLLGLAAYCFQSYILERKK